LAKKIFFGVLILIFSTSIFSTAIAKKVEGAWRLDGSASADLPRNFRLMTDNFQNNSRGKSPNRRGLENLHVSASAQPSLAALQTIYNKIYTLEPNFKLFMVDLRQESHGFVNSLPVSWHEKNNAANFGKTTTEIEDFEVEQLNNLRGIETTFTPMGNSDTKILKSVTIIPHFVENERDSAEKIGFNYVRYAVADGTFPAPEIVDDFLIFVANLPENSWLHFHCHAGQGRTTTFLVMYDILKNPDIDLEEICRRQYLLGGSNLLLEPEGDDFWSKNARERAKMIKMFYEFVQGTRSEQIGVQWSEYLQLERKN